VRQALSDAAAQFQPLAGRKAPLAHLSHGSENGLDLIPVVDQVMGLVREEHLVLSAILP
jgi:hypothetical protein